MSGTHAASDALNMVSDTMTKLPCDNGFVSLDEKNLSTIVRLINQISASVRNLEIEVSVFRMLESSGLAARAAEQMAFQQLQELRRPKVKPEGDAEFQPIRTADDLKPDGNVVKPDFGKKPDR